MIENFKEILFNDGGNLSLVGKLLTLLLIYIGVKIVSKIILKFIDNAIYKKSEVFGVSDMRLKTTTEMTKKIVRVVVYFIGITMGLEVCGISIAPILATAGIGSIAIGFGAQSLVKDIITGFFILLEDQFRVGELVKLAGYEGYVEDFGIRSTTLRDFNGDLYVIPNHEIIIVTNKSRGDKIAFVSIKIPYREDSGYIIKIIQDRLDQVKESIPEIVSGPEVMGVSDLNDYSYTITVKTTTVNGENWMVQRKIRAEILKLLKEHNIVIDFPVSMIKEVDV